jgi:methionyl-tRNA synthetase
LNIINAGRDNISNSVRKFRFREAIHHFMDIARNGNQYLALEEPWKTIKTDEERTKTIMFIMLQIVGALAILSEPFLPYTSEKLKRMLRFSELNIPLWKDVKYQNTLIPAGHQIGKAELLFSKIEDDQMQQQRDKLEASKKTNEAMNTSIAPQKDIVTFDDFTKLDMRVGTIVEAEKMPKTKKLMVLKVDTGIDVRTIVSGIAEGFNAEEVIGKRVTVLINLAPRALRGVESEGMILMTETADGKLVFVNPDEDGVDNGATIN